VSRLVDHLGQVLPAVGERLLALVGRQEVDLAEDEDDLVT
jgi:hypothetical protein